MLKRKSLVLAKIESTYGTDPTPTPAANAILVENVDVKPSGEKLARAFDRPSLSALPHVIGMKFVEVSFKTELKGPGNANVGGAVNVPEIDPLLQACGLGVTLIAETTGGAGDGHIDYSPISSGMKSVTLYVYLDGILHKIQGCVGNVKASLEAGKYGSLEWSFKGLYQDPTDAAIPGGAVLSTANAPYPILAANFSIGGYAGIIKTLSFDLANKIEQRVSANAAEGVVGYEIVDREAKGQIDPEAVTIATQDFWSKWKNSTAQALAVTVGAAAGKKIDVTAPGVVYDSIAWGERSGRRIYTLPFVFAQSAGDDEIKLKFY